MYPGQNVVLLTASTAVSHVAEHNDLDADPGARSRLAGPIRQPSTTTESGSASGGTSNCSFRCGAASGCR
jgi:hypothetical protein